MSNETNFKTILPIFRVIDQLESRLIEFLQNVKRRVLIYQKKSKFTTDFSRYKGLDFILLVNKRLFTLFYYIYILPWIYIWKFIYNIFYIHLLIIVQDSQIIQSYSKEFRIYIDIFLHIRNKIIQSQAFELIQFCFFALIELILFIVWPFQNKENQSSLERTYSFNELSEVVNYEEVEIEREEEESSQPMLLRSMHNPVPMNPFKVSLRIYKALVPKYSYSLTPEVLKDSKENLPSIDHLQADSPASFPPTPFSRAYVMNRASEKVVSVMFAARDRLRLEAQSVSKDEYSRLAANEAKSRGQLATYDPTQASNGIVLSCGNHCVTKVGKMLCSSCRAMVPIRFDQYVYFEFSVTVSSSQQPSLALGLVPPDCPLNVMVGSWPRSIGLYCDGQILIDSRWYQNRSGDQIKPGSTIGILVYIPSGSPLINDEPENDRPLDFNLDSVSGHETIGSNDSPQIIVKFNINGKPIPFDFNCSEVLKEVSLLNAPWYPTVSLFSEDTRVWSRFCEADIVYRSRENIQAPPGVRIYSLDGSLLLDENDQLF